MKKLILIAAVALLVGGGAGFYSGMQYGTGQAVSAAGSRSQFASGRMNRGGGGFGGGGFAGGEVAAKDSTSLTIKTNDGSSKIVFLASSTKVMKSVDGSLNDLTVGSQVTIAGSANPDGSITAQSIQLRTAIPPGSLPNPRQ